MFVVVAFTSSFYHSTGTMQYSHDLKIIYNLIRAFIHDWGVNILWVQPVILYLWIIDLNNIQQKYFIVSDQFNNRAFSWLIFTYTATFYIFLIVLDTWQLLSWLLISVVMLTWLLLIMATIFLTDNFCKVKFETTYLYQV